MKFWGLWMRRCEGKTEKEEKKKRKGGWSCWECMYVCMYVYRWREREGGGKRLLPSDSLIDIDTPFVFTIRTYIEEKVGINIRVNMKYIIVAEFQSDLKNICY